MSLSGLKERSMQTEGFDTELTFTIHGVNAPGAHDTSVLADVFVSKFEAILSALREADKALNPVSSDRHEFVITDLKYGSAVVRLSERAKTSKKVRVPSTRRRRSAIGAFLRCADAVYRNNRVVAWEHDELPSKVAAVCRGAGERFSHIEFQSPATPVVRVDDYLARQSVRLISEGRTEEVSRHFLGQSDEAFDGYFREVDFRGTIPRGKLVLKGGSVELDCILRGIPLKQIKAAINTRVWMEGDAIYDGTSELPARIDARSMTPIQKADIRQFSGKVSGFEELDWERFAGAI
jgi:hypothetical protein